MDWASGSVPIHLDQFDGSLTWIFVKKSCGPFEPAGRRPGRGLVPQPHEMIYVDRDGNDRMAQARIAAPCLVWERLAGTTPVTLRLEGDIGSPERSRVAESVR